ncbi:MAG: DUF697 domain-containing protein [Saprospiraceae bacterium]
MKKIIQTINKAKKIIAPMSDLRDVQGKHADTIIRNHVIFSMGAGAVPVFFIDSVGVLAAQLDMVRQLSKVYNVPYEDTKYKSIVSSIISTVLVRLGANSLIKLIPFGGQFVGAVTMSILSGSSTYTLGELFKVHFENGGTMLDIDVDRMKRQFAEKFEKNKEVVKNIRKDHEKARKAGKMDDGGSFTVHNENNKDKGTPVSDDAPSVVAELEKLARMLEKGIIDEKEFKKLKKQLIKNLG